MHWKLGLREKLSYDFIVIIIINSTKISESFIYMPFDNNDDDFASSFYFFYILLNVTISSTSFYISFHQRSDAIAV